MTDSHPAPADHRPHVRIEPARGWVPLRLGELWAYRELLFFLAWRDVKVRYKQTVLGAAWAVIQPALFMVVFTLFFSRVTATGAAELPYPYPLFAFAGLLPWTFFATAVTSAGNSVVGSERLITKVYFPRLAVPFASAGAAVMDFAIGLGVLLLVMPFVGVWPTPRLLLAGVMFLVILATAVGVGTFLAALNVRYRDFRYALPFLVQVGMFATPTVYMPRTGQETGLAGLVLAVNPMVGLVEGFRAAVLGGPIPWDRVAIATVVSAVLLVAGCAYFRRVEDSFADVI